MTLRDWLLAFGDEGHTFRAMAVLFGLGQAVIAAEYLWVRREFAPGGLYSWPLIRSGRPAHGPWLEALRNACFGERGTALLLITRAVAGLVLAWAASGARPLVEGTAVWALTVLSLAFNARLPWGREGADDILVHAALGLAVYVTGRALGAASLGLYYVPAYAALAYVAAGATKVISPAWRNGNAILWALNLQAFGARWAADAVADRPRVRWVLCWSVMVMEMGAPLAVFLPAEGILAVVGISVAFHASLAVVMGLNTFVWAFLPAYPGVFMIWARLHG